MGLRMGLWFGAADGAVVWGCREGWTASERGPTAAKPPPTCFGHENPRLPPSFLRELNTREVSRRLSNPPALPCPPPCCPRPLLSGSNALVSHIKRNTRIPVLGHADGICHVYVDAAADLDSAIKIVLDAKVGRGRGGGGRAGGSYLHEPNEKVPSL